MRFVNRRRIRAVITAALGLCACTTSASAQTDCPEARSSEQRLMRAERAYDDGDIELAIRHLTCVFNAARSNGDAVDGAAASLALGEIYERDGRYQLALQHYERGVAVLAGAASDELFVGELLDDIRASEKRVPSESGTPGGLDVYRGEIEALDLLVGEPDETASSELAIALAINAGNLYLLQNQHEQAELYYRRALGEARSRGQSLLEARVLANLAWNAMRQGDHAAAELLLEESLAGLAPRYRRELRRALLAVAVNHREQGRLDEAVDEANAAIALYRDAGDARGLTVALAHLGTAHYQRAEFATAIAAYTESLAGNESIGDRTVSLHANGGLARAYQSLGNAQEAEAHFDRYLTELGHFTNSWQTDQGRVGIFENQYAMLADYVNAAAQAAVESGDFSIARRATERSRAPVLPSLIRSRAGYPRAEPGRIEARTFLYGDDWYDAQRDLRISFPPTHAMPPNQATNTPVQMAISVGDLDAPADDWELPSRDGAANADAPPMPILLEYFSAPDKTVITVRATDGTVDGAVADVGADELEELIGRLLQSLRVDRPRGVVTAAALEAATASASPDEISRQLHELLIAPVSPYLPRDPGVDVVIVPHLALWRLPFAALKDDAGAYFNERHRLSYISSGSTWRLIADGPRNVDLRRLKAWIGGNPVMPGTIERCGTTVTLQTLPGAEEEARAIQELFEGQAAELFLGRQADNLRLSAWHAEFDVLHLATHGLACPGDPLSSFLVLSDVGPADVVLDRAAGRVTLSGDPRLPVTLAGWERFADIEELRAYEAPSYGGLLEARTVISDFRLNADLVTLSACQTGLGQLSGEGMIGFTRAFLAAGARSLLVSLWKVDDAATKTLMLHFYREYLDHGDKSRALQTAIEKTRSDFPDPEHWAAFSLIGLAE